MTGCPVKNPIISIKIFYEKGGARSQTDKKETDKTSYNGGMENSNLTEARRKNHV